MPGSPQFQKVYVNEGQLRSELESPQTDKQTEIVLISTDV